jgi:hypothetical protein
MLILGLT